MAALSRHRNKEPYGATWPAFAMAAQGRHRREERAGVERLLC